MKKYIQKNLEPMLLGFLIAILTIYFFNTIRDLIISIELIRHKNI